MITAPLPEFLPALPEIVLLIISLGLLVFGVMSKKPAMNLIVSLAQLTLLLILAIILFSPKTRHITFYGLFISDAFSVFIKILILTGGSIVLTISKKSLPQEGIKQFEYPILILFSILGMMIMASAYDLLTLFVGLELQSLSLYIIVTLQRDNLKSSESGLKYFILGALATGLLLYGCSLVYGFTGTTNFSILERIFKGSQDLNNQTNSIGALVGVVFIIAGMAFKISLAPFHMWTPDVYEGTPTSITTFLATVPKIAAFALLARLLTDPFYELTPQWSYILAGLSIASMVLGTFSALYQQNIKRLIAYSAISNMGYALMGLSAGNENGLRSSLIYLFLYMLMTLGIFACLLNMSQRGQEITTLKDLNGIGRIYPGTAFILSFMLFSMAGIPPLPGFFAKLSVLQAVIFVDAYAIAIIGAVVSVIAAAYYLFLIKAMLMEEAVVTFARPHKKHDRSMELVLGGIVIIMVLFFVKPAIFINWTRTAATSLFYLD